MPESPLQRVLGKVQRRWRVRECLHAVAAAGALFGAAMAVFPFAIAAVLAAATLVALLFRSRSLSLTAAARLLEATTAGALDNLVVTAAELEESPRPLRAEIRDEVVRQATDRIAQVDPSDAVRLLHPSLIAVTVVAGCLLLAGAGAGEALRSSGGPSAPGAIGARAGAITVRITPPAYTRRAAETLVDPVQITVLAGSRVRIESNARLLDERTASESASLVFGEQGDDARRFLSLLVVPDLPPSIRVVAPGKDMAFAAPAGQIAVSIQTGDDLGLAALSLRFTKASGGGENVSFSEGEVPLHIERRNDREWVGRTDVSLAGLGLEDGDILVYRAIARDTNPNGTPVQSDQYLIEIGRNSQIADAGFALPSEAKKYAISQQMVIYQTEALLKNKAVNQVEESRPIAMDQRMVRAEVIFLGGGEVEDEVEEAAHSDELTEGRLQHTGRAEMLRAINAMSRAEAQLNAGSVKEALVFEREALVHLERALDRRRYFLRTLPDRSRIDATRRLIGDRREAGSWNRDRQTAPAPGSMDALRRVMRDLAAGTTRDAALAARIAAVDPSSVELQNAGVALASASSNAGRDAAARSAMQALLNHALKSLPSSSTVDLRPAPLAGGLADHMKRPE